MLDFRNVNTLWASVMAETLAHLGVTIAVISPGSRSTPLTVAFASHPQMQAMPILDERSAGFFALGAAKASGQPTVLICTSGTAGANYFPAIIEAYESEIPLMILTADRPPELRDCASGQTIDQQKLFGRYVRRYIDLALPEATLNQLRYVRQVVAHAWHQSQFPVAGPIHLNCPFRDPLAPLITPGADDLTTCLETGFFQHLEGASHPRETLTARPTVPSDLGQTDRGLIIAGPTQPQDAQSYCQAIAALSESLGWPVLADGLSPLRNYAGLNPQLVTTYDLLLRSPHHHAALEPEQVIQLGGLPTSKVLRQWLERVDPLRWVVETSGRNRDPLHGRVVPLAISLAELVKATSRNTPPPETYAKAWIAREAIARQRLKAKFEPLEHLFEAKLSWLLPTLLPPEMPLMIANSMPVRDVEWFWPPNDRGIRPYFSRGANGIDGTLSTAMGIAQHYGKAVLMTGDLALLHDSNGFLNAHQRVGHLTILLMNNQGGGIFETLPIAKFEPPFEAFFATPQQIDFALLAAAHGLTHQTITTWADLAQTLTEWPHTGVRLLELPCDRKADSGLRAELLNAIGNFEL
jgi:2-succinyl-5-enolpyruvyl-6-hydroxy-3-cyclohexene-1-carboxylate synthase